MFYMFLPELNVDVTKSAGDMAKQEIVTKLWVENFMQKHLGDDKW